MAQIMKIKIMLNLPSGEILTLPVENEATFEQFQNTVIENHNLILGKEYFCHDNVSIGNEDNLYSFIRSLSTGDTEGSDTIHYEIYLPDTTENLEEQVKNETDSSFTSHDENMETNTIEQFNVYKEVENLNPLINLNNDTESNSVLNNVLNENIFENVDYEPIHVNNAIENNMTENGGQINETTPENLITSIEKCSENTEIPIQEFKHSENIVDINEDHQMFNYMEIESKLREIHSHSDESVTDFCRLCAQILPHNKFLIYDDVEKYYEKINYCLPINVKSEDGLPNQICESCLTQLKSFSEFAQNVLEADKILRLKFSSLENCDEIPKSISEITQNVKFELVDINNKTSYYLDSALDVEPEIIKCRLCELILPDIESSVQHSTEIHSNTSGLCLCVLCELGFTCSESLAEHVQEKHKSLDKHIFQCNACSEQFITQTLLEKHICITLKKDTSLSNLANLTLHCEICSHAFSTKQRLNFHRQFHLKNVRPLFCEICKIDFQNENEFFDHDNFLHGPKEYFVCDTCEKPFTSRSALINHKKVHVGERRNHKCEVCDKRFLNKQTLQEHQVCHLETKPYQCHICGKNLSRISRLRKHLLTHESDPIVNDIYACNVCNATFANDQCATIHRLNEHNSEDCIEVISTDRVFRCEFCENCYSTLNALNVHREEHTGSMPYTCHICREKFSSYSRCTTHKITHGLFKEGAEKESYPVVKHFLCERCGKSYLHWSHLALHRKLKHSQPIQMKKCGDCNMSFQNVFGLNNHRRSVHHGNPVKCDDCGKYMPNLKLLQLHQSTQHSEKYKDFQCEQCGKAFAYQVSMEAHMKTHMIKEYKCTRCPKSFQYAAGLANHLKLHKERRFACSHCDQRFTLRTECEEHEELHIVRKFTCEICGKNYESKELLSEHSKVHYNRPYVCDVCGLSFRRPFTLRTHKHRHTKVKHSGSFVLMVDMKEDGQGVQEIPDNNVGYVQNSVEPLATENTYIQLGLEDQSNENYIDIGNGNYVKVQGNTVNIDGKDYILIDEAGKAIAKNQQFQMIVDDNSEENQPVQQSVTDEFGNSIMLVEGENPIILNQSQIQPEYIFASNRTIAKPSTAYVIGNQFVLGTDDQITF